MLRGWHTLITSPVVHIIRTDHRIGNRHHANNRLPYRLSISQLVGLRLPCRLPTCRPFRGLSSLTGNAQIGHALNGVELGTVASEVARLLASEISVGVNLSEIDREAVRPHVKPWAEFGQMTDLGASEKQHSVSVRITNWDRFVRGVGLTPPLVLVNSPTSPQKGRSEG